TRVLLIAAVKNTIGVAFRLASARKRAATSPPTMRGMMTSSNTRSGRNSRAAGRASSAQFATRTSYSLVCSRFSLSSRVKLTSSSIKRIRFFFIFFSIFCFQHQVHPHSAFGGRFDIYDSAMQIDNLFGDRQAEPCPDSGRFRREERLKNSREFLRRNSKPGILDFIEHDRVAALEMTEGAHVDFCPVY